MFSRNRISLSFFSHITAPECQVQVLSEESPNPVSTQGTISEHFWWKYGENHLQILDEIILNLFVIQHW